MIHPLVYYFPEVFWGGPVYHSMLQRQVVHQEVFRFAHRAFRFVYGMVMVHFAKRELETLLYVISCFGFTYTNFSGLQCSSFLARYDAHLEHFQKVRTLIFIPICHS